MASAQLLRDRPAAFRPTRSRYLNDLPAVRPLSKQEHVDPTDIDPGFARARQSEIRQESGKLLVDLHLGRVDPFVVAGAGALAGAFDDTVDGRRSAQTRGPANGNERGARYDCRAHQRGVARANPVQESRDRGDNCAFVTLSARGSGGQQRGDRHGGRYGRTADERVHDVLSPLRWDYTCSFS